MSQSPQAFTRRQTDARRETDARQDARQDAQTRDARRRTQTQMHTDARQDARRRCTQTQMHTDADAHRRRCTQTQDADAHRRETQMHTDARQDARRETRDARRRRRRRTQTQTHKLSQTPHIHTTDILKIVCSGFVTKSNVWKEYCLTPFEGTVKISRLIEWCYPLNLLEILYGMTGNNKIRYPSGNIKHFHGYCESFPSVHISLSPYQNFSCLHFICCLYRFSKS